MFVAFGDDVDSRWKIDIGVKRLEPELNPNEQSLSFDTASSGRGKGNPERGLELNLEKETIPFGFSPPA